MTDFFDDFDWQDMAFWGGMAEEFAEEERERRRWEREQFQDPADECDGDFDMLQSRQPDSRPNARRLPRRKPFEQYAYEVTRGLKHHHDPLYGPAQRRRGVSRRTKNYRDTILYGVLVKNAHLVSENFLKFVCTILYAHRDQDIYQVIFDPDGKPVVGGHEVFSTYDRESRNITMNLRRHFGNAVRVAEHGYTGFSMYALIWINMVGGILHELKHALDACEPSYMDYMPREEKERIADGWAAEAKTYYACHNQTEIPELSEEPYFGPLVNEYLKLVTGNSPAQWALNQQEMCRAGIFYRNKKAGIEIRSMQEYYELSLKGLDGDELGQRLNDCHKKEIELEELIWQREEMSEMALNEAINFQQRLRIDHVDPDGSRTSQTMIPRRIFSKNYYLWVETEEAETGQPVTVRVDRIENIVFLS